MATEVIELKVKSTSTENGSELERIAIACVNAGCVLRDKNYGKCMITNRDKKCNYHLQDNYGWTCSYENK